MSTAPTTPPTNTEAQGNSRQHPNWFSPTALSLYDSCPRSYEYAYLEKPEVDEPFSPHLILANAVHEALRFLYCAPVAQRSVALAHQALRTYWLRQRHRDQAFLNEAEEGKWGRDALEMLERFCVKRHEELNVEPLLVEEWVRAPLWNGFSVTGKVDRVERIELPATAVGGDEADEPVRGLRVTDYKTGRCRINSGEELAEERAAQVYALATSRRLHEPVLEVRYLYLPENKAVTWDVEREDLAALDNRLAGAIESITNDEDFEARPDFGCQWCNYRHLCPEGGRATDVSQLDANPETVF